MPAVSAPSKVLVTGANGYIAAHVVVQLVERGYTVVGTVRSASKGEYLKKLTRTNFEYIVVPDIESPTAYDEAVKGVDAVLHIASPVAMTDGDPQTIIGPALAGTLNILEAAKKNGSNIKRVVVTSSTVALADNLHDENTWNDAAVADVERDGAAAPGGQKYSASKVLAERAAWDFMEKNKGKVSFDLTVLNPPWVWGPMIHEGTTPSSINFSNAFVLYHLGKDTVKGEDLVTPITSASYTDVRDIATIHILLLETEKAGNERFIGASDEWTWQEIYDVLNEDPAVPDVPVGEPGRKRTAPRMKVFSHKVLDVLGKKHDEVYRPLKDSIRDMVESARARGWVWTGKEI